MTYDLSRNPLDRVVEALVLCADCVSPEYLPLVDDQVYRIVVSSYLYMFVQHVAISHQTGKSYGTSWGIQTDQNHIVIGTTSFRPRLTHNYI